MTQEIEPNCREDLQEIEFFIRNLLTYCENGEEIMVVGAILRFLEEFDNRMPSPTQAALAVIGQHDEFDHLVREISIQACDDTLLFGSGEHFAPGPSLLDDTLGYNRFLLQRGQTPDQFLLEDWLSYAQLVVADVRRFQGVI